MPSTTSRTPARKGSTSTAKKLKPIPREPAYERGDLRNALVEEGRKMFEEIGASELSLRALARRLGVSEAAPSRHFTGKEELLAAIAVSGFKELAEQRTKIAAQNLEPFPKARAMMLSYVRYAQTHAGLFDLMTGPRLLQQFVRRDVEGISNVSYSYFADSVFELALASGWAQKDLHYLSHAAWSTEHGVAALILAGRIPRTDSNIDVERMIEFSIDVFLAAVTAGPDLLKRVHVRDLIAASA
nr:TetR/AcrR family transcriptional regulator [uncultured Roseateles sp.]